MPYEPKRGKNAALGCLILASIFSALSILLYTWMNTTLVYDPGDEVRIAYFEYGERNRQVLSRLPWGTWIGWANGDGALQIECYEGSRPVGSYVGVWGIEATVKKDCQVEYDW